MTLDDLIAAYRNDTDSPIHKLRYATKENYRGLLTRLSAAYGPLDLKEVNGRRLKQWHEAWMAPDEPEGKPKITVSHGMIGMLRTLTNFGATMIEDQDCDRLATALGRMRFPMGKPRSQTMTIEQIVAIRERAHAIGLHSIALAQAIQFEGTLRQRDVIGEWIPVGEKGQAILVHDEMKWLRGITWQEIDDDLVLNHITSKRNKPVRIPLKKAPMVMEELPPFSIMPSAGPIVVCERTGRPWTTIGFRRMWRRIADDVGIPKEIYNMDTRASAITEAFQSGAQSDDIRKSATHSNLHTTNGYNRRESEAIERVMDSRVAARAGDSA